MKLGAAKAHKKTKKNVNTGPKIKTSGSDEKDKCLLYIRKAVSTGLIKGRDIYAGFNSVIKLIESGRANTIVSFRDTPASILNALKETAQSRGIPVVIFGRISSEFGQSLGLKKLSCFAIPFASHIEAPGGAEDENHELSIALDLLRDFIVEVAKSSHHSSENCKS